jgi:branched-chain amino acid aminotransferase
MTGIVYLNGKYLPQNRARIAISDSGLLYGYGCYETMRGYHGSIFRLGAHLNRLAHAAQTLKIPLNTEEVNSAVSEIARKNPFLNSRVRVALTGGKINPLEAGQLVTQPTLLVTAAEYHPYAEDIYQKGFQVTIARASRNSQSTLTCLKTTCFLESLLARRQALEDGFDDALLLNENGLLAEATSSNLFILSGGILKTPKLGTGLLPGVTRQVVLDIAGQHAIKALETDIGPAEMIAAEEMFITNSMIEIMPVVGVDRKAVGQGRPGPLTQSLMVVYRDLLIKEIGR